MQLAALCALAVPALVQEAPRAEEPAAEVVRKIFDEALASENAFAILSELVAAAPLRLSGSAGAARAVEWAKARMEQCGLERVRLEACTVPVWVRGVEQVLEIDDVDDSSLAILALAPSVATPPLGLVAEVVEVRSFEELRALGERARGKLVFFNRPMDRRTPYAFDAYGGAVDQRVRGASEAAKAGAVGAIVRSMTMRIDDLPHTGSMRYEDGVEKIPAVAISTAAAERLSAQIRASAGKLKLRLALDCKTLADAPSANVVGEIVGREKPDEIVLIGAHLDAWDVGQGAHDDGAGCAQVIEALRILKALDLRPRRTLRAVLFMNEENGLRGARAYAETHAGELAQHVFALESDHGGFVPRGFGFKASPQALDVLHPLVALFESWGAGQTFADGGGADISVLDASGVVLADLRPDGSRYFDVHHCEADVLSAVNPRELALGAGAIAGLAFLVADLPQALPRRP